VNISSTHIVEHTSVIKSENYANNLSGRLKALNLYYISHNARRLSPALTCRGVFGSFIQQQL